MDPGCGQARTLDDYRDPITHKLSFVVRGFIKDPVDLSFLTIAVSDNVHVTVTDDFGNQTGFNSATGGTVQEIAHSFTHHDWETDPETEEEFPGSNLVNLYTPRTGIYQVTVTGPAGPYAATIMGSSTAGTSNPGEPIIRKGVLVDG